MAANSVGLYIGSEYADLAVVSGTFRAPRVVASGRVPIPSAAWKIQIRTEEGELTQAPPKAPAGDPIQEVSLAVLSLFKQVNLRPSQVYVAVAPEAVIIRYFQMPTIPPGERRTAIAYEAKKYLPFKLEELVTDFQVVMTRSDPAVMRVMFFGMKRNLSLLYQTLLKSLGADPICLEPAAVSLTRLLRQSGQLTAGQASAILSVEKNSATISIAREDLLYLSRNTTVIPASESTAALTPELMEALVSETRVSVDYYRRRFLGEPPVHKVILFAKEAGKNQVDELSSALEIPVELGDPLRKITGVKEVSGGVPVALGLALRGLERKPGDPNLLPTAVKRGEPSGLRKPLTTAAFVAALLLGGGFLLSMFDLNQRQAKVDALRAQHVFPPGTHAQMALPELSQFRQERSQEVRFLKQLTENNGKSSFLLAEVANLLPPDAWLDQAVLQDTLDEGERTARMSYVNRRTLSLAGGSYSNNGDKELQDINLFLSQLKSSPLINSLLPHLNLDSVARGLYYEDLEVTEFNLSGAAKAEDLEMSRQRSGSRSLIRPGGNR